MRVLKNLLLFVNSASSLVFAVYAYLVLWGSINLGFLVMPMINPKDLTFSMAILWIGVPGMLHVLFEAAGPLARAPGNVFLYVCSLLTSIPSIAVVGFAYLLWPFPAYDATTFQWGALVLWGPAALSEIFIAIGVGARLLQRSWFGEGGLHEGGHH